MAEVSLICPDRAFVKEIKASGGDTLSKCYQCATCASVCDLSPANKPFPRKEMHLAQWGQKERLMSDPDVWLCHQCNDCSLRCPRGARPGDVMAAIRRQAFKHYAVPQFMGKLLSTPSGLPILLLIPLLIITGLVFMHTGGDLGQVMQHEVEYGEFVPHGYIEGLFIGGNVLIFLFASIGLSRFYKSMNQNCGDKSKIGFIPAVVLAAKDIILHSRFGKCEAGKYRSVAHMLVFFGFFGAGATAGLALAAMIIAPETYPPIPMTSPIKWLGNVSGLSMLIGLGIIISQRNRDDERAGKVTPTHSIFIWLLLFVPLSGVLLQPFRILDLRMVAYTTYFLHLLAVYYLLWYAPYSQFGHMFYRALAMVFARSLNRMPRAS